ncbi:MAG: DUF2971 domain-containing protein [Alphaproteobacteria bacterium]
MSVDVTTDEHGGYGRFVMETLADFGLQSSPPKRLWHYTDGRGLIGIVSTKTLWATQISCLNDASELRYSYSLLKLAFTDISFRDSDPVAGYVSARMLDLLSEDSARTSHWFVACLSEREDDLNQWRGYGGGENGYAIVIDGQILNAKLFGKKTYMARVNYDHDMHMRLATHVAHATINKFREGLDRRPGIDRDTWFQVFIDNWRQHITYFAPVIKHPSFRDESEWRLLYELRREDEGRLEFRPTRTFISRYVPLSMIRDERIPIVEAWIGPSRHKEISQVSVGDLLRSNGYPSEVFQRVRLSDVPYQGP